jgi:hypothetical protein
MRIAGSVLLMAIAFGLALRAAPSLVDDPPSNSIPALTAGGAP